MDLQEFEICIKQGTYFGAADSPVPTALTPDTKYNLATVYPPLSKGVIYFVSLRTVTVGGMKSDFSPAVSFSLTWYHLHGFTRSFNAFPAAP